MSKALRYLMACALAGASSAAAHADVIVIGSNSPAVAVATVLGNDASLDILEGVSVRLMAQSGKVQTIKGPLKKSVRELAGDGPVDSSLWNSVKEQLAATGAVKESAEGVPRKRGLVAKPAVQAAVPAPAAEPYKFSWVTVPVFASGDVCVGKGSKLSLVRANNEKAERIAVVDVLGGGKRAEVTFAPGAGTMPWPSEIEPRTGTYAFQVAEQPVRQIKLRLIAPLPQADDAVRVLHGQRCEMQRNALLEALKDPAFQISSLP